ncbi:MAG TPA: hypothetical protein VHS59_06875 [Bacillota bacterium]|nr:hypothetical protein [Bacillota bacterium]
MATTVVGVFSSRQQAEDALHTLRGQMNDQNVAIIVRSEKSGNSHGQQNYASDTWNLANTAMGLTASAGDLIGRTIAFTAKAGFTLPLRMMAPLMNGVYNMSGMSGNMAGMSGNMSNMSGSMGSTGQCCSVQGMSFDGAIGNAQQAEKVEITIQGEGNLLASVDILRDHGAKQVNTYTA